MARYEVKDRLLTLLHPLVLLFPAPLWIAALIFDVFARPELGGLVLRQLAFWALTLGIGSSLCWIPVGICLWKQTRFDDPARRKWLWFALVSLGSVTVAAVNLLARELFAPTDWIPLSLSVFTVTGVLLSTALANRCVAAEMRATEWLYKDFPPLRLRV